MILGQGSYGKVSIKNNKAVKKFNKLSHLIQEYIALRYLKDCNYIVQLESVNFKDLELYMELYDCNLRVWLENHQEDENYFQYITKIIHDVLMGLIELHDRNLVHGDLKPSNILIKEQPLKAVLGDCGFVSVSKYAKVDRTAPIYRDPVISFDKSHDMFSLGVCLIEILGRVRIYQQLNYKELKAIAKDNISTSKYYKVVSKLISKDKSKRPSARELLNYLFKKTPVLWINPFKSDYSKRITISISSRDKEYIYKTMKTLCNSFNINRGKKGFGALIYYIDQYNIQPYQYNFYINIIILILSSLFGKSGFSETQILINCNYQYSINDLYKLLEQMLSDDKFIGILLS